jgi:hypothetical protein
MNIAETHRMSKFSVKIAKHNPMDIPTSTAISHTGNC